MSSFIYMFRIEWQVWMSFLLLVKKNNCCEITVFCSDRIRSAATMHLSHALRLLFIFYIRVLITAAAQGRPFSGQKRKTTTAFQWLSNFVLSVFEIQMSCLRELFPSGICLLLYYLTLIIPLLSPPPWVRNHKLRGSWWNPKHEVVTWLSNPTLDFSLDDLLLWPTDRLRTCDLLFSISSVAFYQSLCRKVKNINIGSVCPQIKGEGLFGCMALLFSCLKDSSNVSATVIWIGDRRSIEGCFAMDACEGLNLIKGEIITGNMNYRLSHSWAKN